MSGLRGRTASLLVALSLSVAVADHTGGAAAPVDGLREVVRGGLARLEEAATRPLAAVVAALGRADDLARENARLRRRVAGDRGRAEWADALARDNAQLASLAGLSSPGAAAQVPARVVALPAGRPGSGLLLDRGSEAGIEVGMPVLAGGVLVGRVVAASAGQATVVPIVDPGSAVGVRLAESGEVGVVEGTGLGLRLQLLNPEVEASERGPGRHRGPAAQSVPARIARRSRRSRGTVRNPPGGREPAGSSRSPGVAGAGVTLPAPAGNFGDGLTRGVGLSVPKDRGAFFWRLGILLMVTIVAQALVAPRLGLPGAAPDLLLLTTVAVAGTTPGSGAVIFGFAAGLAADLFLVTPFGLSAAAFTAVARAGAAFPAPRRALLVAPRVAVGAVLAGALVTFAAAALGQGPVPSPTTLGLLVRASVTTAALSPPMFAAVRRLVGCGPPV